MIYIKLSLSITECFRFLISLNFKMDEQCIAYDAYASTSLNYHHDVYKSTFCI